MSNFNESTRRELAYMIQRAALHEVEASERKWREEIGRRPKFFLVSGAAWIAAGALVIATIVCPLRFFLGSWAFIAAITAIVSWPRNKIVRRVADLEKAKQRIAWISDRMMTGKLEVIVQAGMVQLQGVESYTMISGQSVPNFVLDEVVTFEPAFVDRLRALVTSQDRAEVLECFRRTFG